MGRLEFHGIAGLDLLNIQGMTGDWKIHGMAGLIFMGRPEAGKFIGWPEYFHGTTGKFMG